MNILWKRAQSVAAVAVWSLLHTVNALATEVDSRKFILNYDIVISLPDGGSDIGKIRQFGVPVLAQREFVGRDFEDTEYIFTISSIDGSIGRLVVEFYRFETRAKSGDPVSDFLTEIDFRLGEPAQIQAKLGEFSIDLAFNISER